MPRNKPLPPPAQRLFLHVHATRGPGTADASLRAPPFRDAPPYTFDASKRTPATPNTTARHASIARRPRTYRRRAPSVENTSA